MPLKSMSGTFLVDVIKYYEEVNLWRKEYILAYCYLGLFHHGGEENMVSRREGIMSEVEGN